MDTKGRRRSGGSRPSPRPVELGLGANRRQFWLLVLVNAFVGAMVGLERTVLPLLAEAEFGLASRSAVLSFIATFGLVKALTNFFAGRLGDLLGRKQVLVAGWLFAIPVPFLVIWAPSWGWIVFANVLLGINQGLAWSTTVIMKIDLVGPRQRGLAMGLNEFAGYVAVALAALGTGYIAEVYALRPEPFYLGIGFAAAGLALTVLFVRDTSEHVALEAASHPRSAVGGERDRPPGGRQVFMLASWRHPTLFSASQAGLVTNLKDGLAWGLFPLFFSAAGLSVGAIGLLAFVYPAFWGVLQPWTGSLSDRFGRRRLVAAGMAVQGLALVLIAVGGGMTAWLGGSALLGIGTAMAYPALLAAVSDVSHPSWRASAVGVYRLWRDSGYAFGALLAGVLADLFGMRPAIIVIAAIAMASATHVAARMHETVPLRECLPHR